VRGIGIGAGFLSTDEDTQTFGVPADAVDIRLRVTWPNGATDDHVGLVPGSYVARPGELTRR
jgi:hypothetical protein